MATPHGYGGEPEDESTRVLVADDEPHEHADTLETAASNEHLKRAPGPDRTEPLIIGRYVIERRVGAGGMGVVYLATDPKLDRRVALKVLSSKGSSMRRAEASERLEREARALAMVRHPNVVAIHDVGRHDDAVFVVMEYIEGADLRRWLSETIKPRSWKAVVDVLIEAGAGLEAVHAAGLVHRDFKPANVLVAHDQRVLVTDFGLAREAGPDTGSLSSGSTFSTELTAVGAVMGTPPYMSPELLRGEAASPISDQWAFCVSLWQGLYGRRPFEGHTIRDLRETIEAGPPTRPPRSSVPRPGSVPRWLHRALLRGLEPDPSLRWPSMDALLRTLRRGRRGSRRELAAAAAVVGAGVLVALSMKGEPVLPCEDGTSRVEGVWSSEAREALQIGGDDYTALHVEQTRARFEHALDEYATRWAEAYQQSCTVVGPHAQRGTSAEQATAECIENRLGSLQGLAELATTSPLDAARADTLAESLPAIEDCTAGRWVPYPTGPGEAERAAALDELTSAIRRERLAERRDGLHERAEALVQDARALGDAYRLARALAEQARTLGPDELDEAFPRLDEALELAITAGHDGLAAHIVNHTLLTLLRDPAPSWREVRHLAALARALLTRSGSDDPELLGNVLLNQGSLLRNMGRLDEAMVYDQQAEEVFAHAENRAGVAKARFNRMVSLVRLDRFDEAEPQLPGVIDELEATLGESSTPAITARRAQLAALFLYGRPREALEPSRELYRITREHYAPGSSVYRDLTFQHVVISLQAGELGEAERALADASTHEGMSDGERLDREILAAMLALARRQDERVSSMLVTLEPLISEHGDQDERAWLTVTKGELELLAGRPEGVRALLADPATWKALGHESLDLGFRVEAALLAALSEAPVPAPETSWRALLHIETTRRPSQRLLLEVIAAIEAGTDTTATVQHVRDELARMYFDGVVSVQLLDAWLAQRRDDSPDHLR